MNKNKYSKKKNKVKSRTRITRNKRLRNTRRLSKRSNKLSKRKTNLKKNKRGGKGYSLNKNRKYKQTGRGPPKVYDFKNLTLEDTKDKPVEQQCSILEKDKYTVSYCEWNKPESVINKNVMSTKEDFQVAAEKAFVRFEEILKIDELGKIIHLKGWGSNIKESDKNKVKPIMDNLLNKLLFYDTISFDGDDFNQENFTFIIPDWINQRQESNKVTNILAFKEEDKASKFIEGFVNPLVDEIKKYEVIYTDENDIIHKYNEGDDKKKVKIRLVGIDIKELDELSTQIFKNTKGHYSKFYKNFRDYKNSLKQAKTFIKNNYTKETIVDELTDTEKKKIEKVIITPDTVLDYIDNLNYTNLKTLLTKLIVAPINKNNENLKGTTITQNLNINKAKNDVEESYKQLKGIHKSYFQYHHDNRNVPDHILKGLYGVKMTSKNFKRNTNILAFGGGDITKCEALYLEILKKNNHDLKAEINWHIVVVNRKDNKEEPSIKIEDNVVKGLTKVDKPNIPEYKKFTKYPGLNRDEGLKNNYEYLTNT